MLPRQRRSAPAPLALALPYHWVLVTTYHRRVFNAGHLSLEARPGRGVARARQLSAVDDGVLVADGSGVDEALQDPAGAGGARGWCRGARFMPPDPPIVKTG
jgi:hypothetical protein